MVHGSCRFYPSRPIKTCCFRATDALGSCPSARAPPISCRWFVGRETQPGSLHGFQTNLSDAFVQLPAGAHIQVALISQTRFEQLATATGDHQTLEVIQRTNSANLHPQRFDEISALIQAQLMGGGQEDLVEVAALEALSPHQLQGTASGELGVGAGLMKDLVAWGFKNTGQAITLNDLSATIFASRSSIVHHCRQSFGTGPMALLKQIRLSQVHHALSSCLLYTSPSPRDS